MKLWQKVVTGLVLGILLGYLMNANGPLGFDGKAGHYDGKLLLKTYLLPFGNTFIDLIKMVVVPLIFFSLISGVTSMTDSGAFKRIGMKAAIAFISTAAFAVVIGLVFATVFQPGRGVNLKELASVAEPIKAAPVTAARAPGVVSVATPGGKVDAPAPKQEEFTLSTLLSDIVPNNIIAAMGNNDHILQVVVFALFTAATINALGEQAKVIREFCYSAAKVVFKMIDSIMKLSPYGVFAIIAPVVASQGLSIVESLAVLVLTVAGALFLQYLLFGVMLVAFGKLSPMPFYRKVVETQSFAFSTSSSKATLPTAMRVANERMGVSKSNTSFILPLGASINMDGTAIYLGICSLFFAQAYGIQFSVQQYILLVLTATLGSIGAAGIPSGSILMMGMVFSSVGLPLSGIGVILGIDRILDMLRTTVNITGDSVITLLVDKSEGTFDEKAYYDNTL